MTTKIYGYIQNKQSEKVLWHGTMTQENAEHFLTSRGLSVEDHTIVLDATGIDVQKMIDAYDESIKTYSQKRKDEYDQMGEQFEMIFDDQDAWRNKINEIKAKYPKE